VKNKLSIEEAILETLPFSDELIKWCKNNEPFFKGLKNIYVEKFLSLGAIVTSYPKNSNDQVIGLYTYDYQRNVPLFKQDFIVNINNLNNEFILYTRNKKYGSSRYVKDINAFYKLYGKNSDYNNSHHLSLEDLPILLRKRGEHVIKLAETINKTGIRKLTRSQLRKKYNDIKKIKKEKWFTKYRL